MAGSNTKDEAPVSFTDTNAETGMTERKATLSHMEDLIGALNKEAKIVEEKPKKEPEEEEPVKKKKKKKTKKGKKKGKKKNKYKKVLKQDKYEPNNYLMRIEGTVCFAVMVHVALYVLLTLVIFAVLLIWSGADMNYLILKEPYTPEEQSNTITKKTVPSTTTLKTMIMNGTTRAMVSSNTTAKPK